MMTSNIRQLCAKVVQNRRLLNDVNKQVSTISVIYVIIVVNHIHSYKLVVGFYLFKGVLNPSFPSFSFELKKY